jgi:hypothetical protein
VAFDVHRLAEFARRDDTPHLLHVGPEPIVLAERQHNAVPPACINCTGCIIAGQRKRLLAEYRLACFGGGDDLLGMQRVWGRQHHGLYGLVGQELGQRRQRKAMTLSECRHRPDIATCAAYEAQAVALALDRPYEVLAPPAEANNASIDHHTSIAHVADVESRARLAAGSG